MRDALLLAAGELRRAALRQTVETDQFASVCYTRLRISSLRSPSLAAARDILGDGHVRPDRIGLEHHAELALLGRQR